MLTVYLESDVPLVDQIVRGIRCAIALGEVRPGDELPPVRQLANDLGINWNTVARAYRALEAQGLVHSARGRGTRVISDRERQGDPVATRRTRADSALRAVLADARLSGLSRDDIERLFSRGLRAFFDGAQGT